MNHLAWHAFVELWKYDIFESKRGFAEIHGFVAQYPRVHRIPEAGDLQRIVEAVDWAAIWYWKRVMCLQRSVVQTVIMRRHGIPAELVIGARRMPFRSHAWVEVQGVVVNDKERVQQEFSVLERC